MNLNRREKEQPEQSLYQKHLYLLYCVLRKSLKMLNRKSKDSLRLTL